MVNKESSVIEDRDKWLGGSDMRNVFASDNSMVRLAYEKAFSIKQNFSNKYTEYGNLMEPMIREVMCGVFDLDFIEWNNIKNEKYRMRGNLDGYSEAANLILEIKTAVANKTFEDCIEQYKYQLLTYSYLMDRADVILAVLTNYDFKPMIDGNSDLKYNRFTYEALLGLCNLDEVGFLNRIEDFWKEVKNQIKKGEIVVDLTLDDLTEELLEYQKVIDEYKGYVDGVKAEIKKRMDEMHYINYNNYKVTISIKSPHTRTNLDKKKLTADMGVEFVEKYSNIIEVPESIMIKQKKEDTNGDTSEA